MDLYVPSASYNIGQKLAEKALDLKHITANPFPRNFTLPENYMRWLAPHVNKHSFYGMSYTKGHIFIYIAVFKKLTSGYSLVISVLCSTTLQSFHM